MSAFQAELCSQKLESLTRIVNVPFDELSVILMDLQNNRVSILCGKFHLTFGKLACVSLKELNNFNCWFPKNFL